MDAEELAPLSPGSLSGLRLQNIIMCEFHALQCAFVPDPRMAITADSGYQMARKADIKLTLD